MKFFLMLLFLFGTTLPAAASEVRLRIFINLGANSPVTDYELSDRDADAFWDKWAALSKTTDMVPLPTRMGYSGLSLLRPNGVQLRLYGGVAMMGDDQRRDDLRVLERWVLSKAPPPLGPQLVAALDSEVDATKGNLAAPLREIESAEVVIKGCQRRARGNQLLLALCLHEKLLEQVDTAIYAKALKGVAEATLPAVAPAERLTKAGAEPQR